MNFYKTKHEIMSEFKHFENELDCFTDKIDTIKTKFKKDKLKLNIFDTIWNEIINIYTNQFSHIYNLSKTVSDILKDEIILTLYGAALHYTTPGISPKKWYNTCINKNDKTFESFRNNNWKNWLKDELSSYNTSFTDGPNEEERTYSALLKNEELFTGIKYVVPITQKQEKSKSNRFFCNYIDHFVEIITKPVYMGDDIINYLVHFPYPQLIYDIILNWSNCPLNTENYYGIKLETLNDYKKCIISYDSSTNTADTFLRNYIIEEFFHFSFSQSLTALMNDHIVLHSNREEIYSQNALLLQYANRIQSCPSQFLRTKIIRELGESDCNQFLSTNKDANNLLYSFTIPLLEAVFSYYICYIIDDEFETNENNQIYNILLEYCNEYIHTSDYNKYFEYYNQQLLGNYNLKYKCDALEINFSYSIYTMYDNLPNIAQYNSLVKFLSIYNDNATMSNIYNELYNKDYYLRFPFNNIYSQYCYHKEISKYPMTYINHFS